MKTGASTRTLAAIVCAAVAQLPMYYVIAGDNRTTASPEKIDNPFTVDFEFGRKATPFIDPNHPPVLELTSVSWYSRRLIALAHYHNVDSSQPKKVEGRHIVQWQGYPPWFWPYTRLEVSNQWEGPWTAVGSSPSGTDGTDADVLMYPDQAAYVDRSAPESPTCYADITAFQEFIGKFQYGRVVLRSGGTSQTIVLTDLLPPEPLPTPSPSSRGTPTPSQ